MIATIRWLAVIAAPILLGGCFAQLRHCYDPGSQFPKSCYYQLEITGVEDNANGLVTGRVDREVVVQNSTRWFWQKESWPPPFGPDFDVNDYDFAIFTFYVPEWKGNANDMVGRSFEFCSIPNSRDLKLTLPMSEGQTDRCPQSQF